MTRYVFCAWMPSGQMGKSVAEVISVRTKAWSDERAKKGKEGYQYVGWQPEKMEKITLGPDDQIYIKGHHTAGLDFISDIHRDEEQQLQKGKQVAVQATKLDYKQLCTRLHHCFHSSNSFKGKIKFFNCSSGVNGGASFAKKAADRMRAHWPKAEYIGYADDLQQNYGDYNPSAEMDEVQNLRNMFAAAPRRKLGMSGARARSLHVKL